VNNFYEKPIYKTENSSFASFENFFRCLHDSVERVLKMERGCVEPQRMKSFKTTQILCVLRLVEDNTAALRDLARAQIR